MWRLGSGAFCCSATLNERCHSYQWWVYTLVLHGTAIQPLFMPAEYQFIQIQLIMFEVERSWRVPVLWRVSSFLWRGILIRQFPLWKSVAAIWDHGGSSWSPLSSVPHDAQSLKLEANGVDIQSWLEYTIPGWVDCRLQPVVQRIHSTQMFFEQKSQVIQCWIIKGFSFLLILFTSNCLVSLQKTGSCLQCQARAFDEAQQMQQRLEARFYFYQVILNDTWSTEKKHEHKQFDLVSKYIYIYIFWVQFFRSFQNFMYLTTSQLPLACWSTKSFAPRFASGASPLWRGGAAMLQRPLRVTCLGQSHEINKRYLI